MPHPPVKCSTAYVIVLRREVSKYTKVVIVETNVNLFGIIIYKIVDI